VNFDPPQWLIDHSNKENGNSTAGLDYVWSHFCGIFMGTRTHARMRILPRCWPTVKLKLNSRLPGAASTAYFLLYCVLKRNKPVVYPEVVLPGVIAGVMWAVAQSCFFVANQGTVLLSLPRLFIE
jgi:hypothetical protein